MSRSCRRLIALLLVFAYAAGAAADHEDGSAQPEGRPNILFIMADDHGWQAISEYGRSLMPTPGIDRIAREGLRLDRHYVGNAICAPSRATILTGLHSHASGVMDNRAVFDGSRPHIAHALRDAGYQTVLIGKWHLKSEPTGFTLYDRLVGQGAYYNPVFREQDPTRAEGFREYRVTGYATDIVTEKAIDWLRTERDASKPFLLMVHHKAPHRAWRPAIRHLSMFEGVDLPEPPTLFDDWSGKGEPARRQDMTIGRTLDDVDLKLVPPDDLTPGQLAAWTTHYGPKNAELAAADLRGDDLVRWKYQRYVKDYLRTVKAVDEGVGRLLETLDHLDLARRTLVIYTSDQGWYLGEHGWFDKRWMYEESFRTPLLARWPGVIEPGTSSDALTQNIDIAPTLADACGLDVPDGMHGVSLLPVFEAKGPVPEGWRDALYYRYYEFPAVHSVRRHEGVVTDRYKLIHFYRLGTWEFYDLLQDPDEVNNAIDDAAYARVIADLRGTLSRLKERYNVPPGEHYEGP